MLLVKELVLGSSIAGSTFAATSITAWPPYSPTSFPIFQLSSDSQMAFYLAEMFSLANWGRSNTGEILRIATQVVPQDFGSFYEACYYMAEQIFASAESVDVTKDPVSACEAYFHAATYYRGADFFLHGNQSDPRLITLWDQQLTAFNRANALLEILGVRFSVPTHSYEIGDYESIGIFYAAYLDDCARPTILISGGYDSSQEEAYHSQCHQVLSRGVNCVAYEGPGQPSVRRQQNIGFISDWWTVTKPIADLLSTLPRVDMSKLAIAGMSFGGSLAPIAASDDDRYSAVIAIDGMFSARQAFEEQLPQKMVAILNASEVAEFDEVMNGVMVNTNIATGIRWIIGYSLWAFDTLSPFDWFTRLGQITMNETLVAKLHMPVFVAKGQDDVITEQEPEIAYEMLTTGRPNGKALTYYHQSNISTGAGEHCSLGADSQLWLVTMDWLSGIWGNWTKYKRTGLGT